MKHGSYGIVLKHRHIIRQNFAHKIDHFWSRNPKWHFEALWHPKAAAVESVAYDLKEKKGVAHGEALALVKAWECLDTPIYDDVIEVFEDDVVRPEELQADQDWAVKIKNKSYYAH